MTLPKHFSKREWMVVRCFAGGLTKGEIATALGLGEETVREYIRRARTKLRRAGYTEVKTALDLARLVEQGIIK